MRASDLQLLSAGQHRTIPASPTRPPEELWIPPAALEQVTGWSLKTEGLCRDDVCMPVSSTDRDRWVDGEEVCASGLWRALGRPVLHDESRSVWILGEAASDRSAQLESLEAPDFTLPDITGKLHSLSDFRGKKVFLATWASW
jgi:hypothetical protein